MYIERQSNEVLSDLLSDDQTDPLPPHAGAVQPKVGVDYDEVARPEGDAVAGGADRSALWRGLQVPSLHTPQLRLAGRV